MAEAYQSLNTERSLIMCDAYEWLEWRQEEEQRAMKLKADELLKQSKAAAPAKSAQPEKQQEEPVPA